jgi:chromosome partitioning protein
MAQQGRIFAFAIGKGGVGKTTAAVNMAAMSALAGKETLLVDTDFTKPDASFWSTTRHERDVVPSLTSVTKTGKVGFDLTKLREKYEVIIVDCAGADSVEMRQTVAVCDTLVMPMKPAQFDLWSVSRLEGIVKEMSEKMDRTINAYSLLSMVHNNPLVRETQEMRHSLMEFSETFPLLQTHVCDRVAYVRANKSGLGVVELTGSDADSKANQEMMNLYQEIFNEEWQPV